MLESIDNLIPPVMIIEFNKFILILGEEAVISKENYQRIKMSAF